MTSSPKQVACEINLMLAHTYNLSVLGLSYHLYLFQLFIYEYPFITLIGYHC